MKTITTNSPEETMNLAESISAKLDDGDLLALLGDLGAGKTMFVKGLAKGLGIEDYLYVNSPSFVILKEYHGRKDLYHFDVYRLDLRSFCDTLDYEKYFYGKGITVIEWGDKVKEVLPEEHLEIKFSYGEGDERKLEINGFGKKFKEIVSGI